MTVDTHSRGSCEGTENMVKSAIFMNVGPSDAIRKFSVSLKIMLWVWKMFSKLRVMQRTSNHIHPTHQSEYFVDSKFYPPPLAGFQITSLKYVIKIVLTIFILKIFYFHDFEKLLQ